MDTEEYLFTCNAAQTTPEQVATTFALTYWDHPRQIENLKTEGRPGRTTFQVVDGSRTYQIVYLKAVPYERPAVYRVLVSS